VDSDRIQTLDAIAIQQEVDRLLHYNLAA